MPVVRIQDIVMIPVSKLVAHPKNPNKHPPDQIKRLAEIIEWQGWRYPVKVDKASGFVTSGHGRIEAAKLMGWKEVPVSFQDYDNEAMAYADLVSDNAIAEWSDLNLASINNDIVDLGPDFDIDLLGIKDFVLEPAEKFEPQSDEDDVPENAETRVKLGDRWLLGNHVLVCGDSTDPSCWDSIGGRDKTLVFTSPPYGIGDGAKLRDHYVKGAPKLGSLYKDHQDDIGEWLQLMRDWTAMALAHSSAVACNVQMLARNKRDMITWLAEIGSNITDVVIWDKGHGPPQMQENVLTNVFEFIFLLSPENDASRSIPMGSFHGNEGNVIRVGRATNNEFASIHKATMPVELVDWALRVFHGCEHVIDPFGGTGTTMIACEKHNKSCGLIELDPKYCDVILARWEKYTGKTAELQASGPVAEQTEQ